MVKLHGGQPFFAHNVHQSKHAVLFSYLLAHKLEVTVLDGTAERGRGCP